MHQKAATILRFFRQQSGFVSGEQLSKELGISRTAVWKHISALRGAGYRVEAVPSRGYRLLSSPDTLAAEEISVQLHSALIGTRLVNLATTTSTNSEAFRLAEEGAVEGTVVTAEEQSRGKGRLGRIWSSPPGANLYCSVILRPRIKPFEAPQLTFLSAVATARAIEQTTGLKPEIKWPNDVLIDGKKVAGLLNEMSAETDGINDGINFVILGIGVNLNMTADQFPGDLRHPATSLLIEGGAKVGRARFTAFLLNELDRLYAAFLDHGFVPVRREWQERCNANGREVVVSDHGRDDIRGLFAGIDGDGALLVRQPDGTIERILSGDVRVL
ncbi:biotin--[acetyl-CoA-carboxylase] ligase [Oryzomonas sagensis]|uniref:Bifunctional ligase/repressor BirA n=1 Tax=Oryzomonas sagensis TaxID=2603857 RepID=A0ABQ6TLK1_9BACT|nr:biotin--[acetyl-CoA-carboxylase] ligase [Oryzomonas sagensis]KAB0669302.1 biotin--[acetyl-CoA-carboxylase] ligase [Oryzomonas sagensis]